MVTLNKIKSYVDYKLNLDTSDKCKKQYYVFGRVLVAELAYKCMEKVTQEDIAEILNIKRCTICHYRNVLFKEIRKTKPELYEIYLKFKKTLKNSDVEEIEETNEVEDLLNEISYLKYQIELLTNDKSYIHKDFKAILEEVPDDKLDLFKERLKPMVKMLKSHKVY